MSWSFDNMFDCTCNGSNQEGRKDQFNNFWDNSGECCDKLRFTIWIIFNIIFAILFTLVVLKVRRERIKNDEELYNFNTRDKLENRDRIESDFSSVGSIQNPFIG